MRITVLGKSPAWQDADGACTGYLVEGGGQTVLLDCGPGVFAKLRKRIAYEQVDAIVITHLHADHVMDLVPFASGLRYRPWPGEPPRPLKVSDINVVTQQVAGRVTGLRADLAKLPGGSEIYGVHVQTGDQLQGVDTAVAPDECLLVTVSMK